jgi:DNA-binding CsgD family transcriptional regulator
MREAVREAVHAFWDALSDLPGSGDDESLRFALGRLSELVDAQEAYWMGAVRMDDAAPNDPALGWRPRAVRYLSGCSARLANYEVQRQRLEQGAVDPSIVASLRDAGRFRVHIKHRLVGRAWFESDYYRTFMAPFGVQDVLLVAMPLGEDVESWWAFQRIDHERFYFSEEDAETLRYACRSLAWFHRQVALYHGLLLADRPLTGSERRLVRELLTDRTEQDIAAALGLSPATVHTYAVRIYRKFGVRGRTGLMALWLGQAASPSNPAAEAQAS